MKKITLLIFYLCSVIGYSITAGNVLTVTNSKDANTVAKAPQGSFRKILSQASDGDTIVFDPSIKNDTIYVNKYISQSQKNLTIIGNGITIFGKSSGFINFNMSQSITIENLNFSGNSYLSIESVQKSIVRNCTFNNCITNGISVQSLAASDMYTLIEGCHFSNIGSFHGGAIRVVNNMVKQHLTVDIVSCTFVDNVLQSLRTEQEEGIAINAFQYEVLEPIVPTIRIANCVFKNNETHNENNQSGIKHDNPVISAKDLTSLGYNVIEGKVLSVDGWQKHSTDIVSEDVGEIYKLESNIYKVLKSGKAYNNLPANTTIKGVKFPTYDVLGYKIDYTKATNSGAVQKLFTANDASLSQLLSEDGKVIDITKTYLVPQSNTDEALTFIVETAPNAKVVVGENEVADKTITVAVSKPSLQAITFKIVSADATNTESYTFNVEKRFNFDDIVVTRWDNTLLVNANNTTNGSFNFTGYKWFKDGNEVGTGQYYSAGSKKTDILSGSYYVELITKDGQTLRTWEKSIALKSSMIMKAYPNPLHTGEIVSVQLDIDQELLNKAVIEIYNSNGVSVKKTRATGNITSVKMPDQIGLYILKVNAGDFVREEKLMVK